MDFSLLTSERRLDALASAEVRGRGPFWGEGGAEREARLQVSTCSSHASLLAVEVVKNQQVFVKACEPPSFSDLKEHWFLVLPLVLSSEY